LPVSRSPPTTAPRAQEVLDFWFGPGDPLSPPQFAERLHLWFGGDDPPEVIAERDAKVAQRFRPLMDDAAAGALDHWAGSPHRLLALVLLLDQFPRHVYRGRARAYAQDSRALAFSLHALTTGADAALSPAQRLFLYLPLQHSESTAMQEESIAAFRRLLNDSPAQHRVLFESALEFAQQHQQVIQRFGRFPHRNAALSRRSTPEELEFLENPEAPDPGQKKAPQTEHVLRR
jgi:uncharacterized protein (DUF924 family)